MFIARTHTHIMNHLSPHSKCVSHQYLTRTM